MYILSLGFATLAWVASARAEAPASEPVSLPALQRPDGLVVHVEASGRSFDSAVVAHFSTPEGETAEAALTDDGVLPDEHAGDGVWSGATVIRGERATVRLSSGEWEAGLAEIALPSGPSRELDLALSRGRLVVSESAGGRGFQPSGKAGGKGKGSGRRTRHKDAAAKAESNDVWTGGRTRHQAVDAEAASNDVWTIAAGVAGVSLLGIGFFWFRRPRRRVVLPGGVRRVAEVGLFGEGTPRLADGVTVWVVAAEAQPAFAARLVQAVAASRPVLVRAPDSLALAPSPGGPVYRSALASPLELHDAAYELQESHPDLALVLVGCEGPPAEWVRDVGSEFPVLFVVAEPLVGLGEVVRGVPAGDEWRFEVGPPPGEA